MFVLHAVVLQRVGDVEGQALAWRAANKHWHHQVALRWGGGEKPGSGAQAGGTPLLPHTPPLPARLTLTRAKLVIIITVKTIKTASACIALTMHKAWRILRRALHIQVRLILKTTLHNVDH